MKQHFYRNLSLWRMAAALLIVITLSLTTASPALALDLNPNDYFQFNFNAVTFDKSEVAAGEAFHYTITGSADCTKDLPLPVSEVTITSQVVAKPASGGAAIVINPSYVIDIKPLPTKAGQSFNINQTVTLQFPAGNAPGSYYVVAQVISAKVKVVITLDVTGSFPAESNMGKVKCIANTASVTTAPAVTLPAAATTSPGTLSPANATDGTTSLLTIAVIGLIVIVVVLLIIIIFLLRRSRGI
jgi:hypothetical protein